MKYRIVSITNYPQIHRVYSKKHWWNRWNLEDSFHTLEEAESFIRKLADHNRYIECRHYDH